MIVCIFCIHVFSQSASRQSDVTPLSEYNWHFTDLRRSILIQDYSAMTITDIFEVK
jgi:hypothetical protein